MITWLRPFFVLLIAVTLGGCATVDVERYRAETPVLDLRQYFNGTIDGYGIFQKRSGEETVLQSTIKRLKDKLLASEVRDSSVCTRALLARGIPFEQQ